MRQGMRNKLQARVKGMDLTTCTNLVLRIKQCGITKEYTGTADTADTELMNVTIPKADALRYRNMPAKFQVLLTDADGEPRSHKPIVDEIGELLGEEGYGE